MALSKIPADLITGGLSVDPAAPADAITVDSSGNVGIGTSSPASKLDISTGGSTGTTDMVTLSGLDAGSAKQTYGVIRMGIENNTAGAEQGNLHLQTAEAGTVRDRIYLNGSGYMTFSNGGSERMRIDSAGRVTMPYQPSFQAYMPNSPPTHDATGNTAVISDKFTNTFHNVGGHYNTSTGRFTAPIAGRYFFSANVRWETQDFTQNSYIRLVIAKNSTGFTSTELTQINGSNEAWANYMGMSVSGVLQLAAGDYVQLVGGMNNGTAKLHREGSFSGHLLG